MMFTEEELAKQIKIITQNAWRQETNTTINAIVEYIVRESLNIIAEVLLDHELRLEELEQQLEEQQQLNKSETLPGFRIVHKEHIDGKDGGLSQPKGHPKSTNGERPRSNGTTRKQS